MLKVLKRGLKELWMKRAGEEGELLREREGKEGRREGEREGGK